MTGATPLLPLYALMSRMGKTTFFLFVRSFKEGLYLFVQWDRWWCEQQLVPALCWAYFRKKTLWVGGTTPFILRLNTGCRSVVIFTIRFPLTSESVISFHVTWEGGSRVGPDFCRDGCFFLLGDEPQNLDHPTHNCYYYYYYYYYYYWYAALGPVWAETRVQSGDWYGSGTLHPGQVLRGSLPLLSPAITVYSD